MKKKLVVFSSIPDYSGNARALYEYLEVNHPAVESLWLVDGPREGMWWLEQGVKCIPSKSFAGLAALVKADMFVITHGIGRIGRGYKIVSYMLRILMGRRPVHTVMDLGHGRGPKGTGNTSRNEFRWIIHTFALVLERFFISKSLFLSYLIAASYNTHPSKVFITGEPRNDWLLTDDGRANLEKVLGLSLRGKSVILYAPTFRDSNEDFRWHEKTTLPDNIRAMIASREVVHFLTKTNSICVLKLHPHEEHLVASLRSEVRMPLYMLDSSDLQRAKLDLYQILGGVDLLVTDYSSLYIDFLLLDRPVVFYAPDFAHYGEVRGFKLEPLEFWMPGPRVSTMEELVTEVERCLSDPSRYSRERETVVSLIHRYRDANSSERVWNELKALLKGRQRLS